MPIVADLKCTVNILKHIVSAILYFAIHYTNDDHAAKRQPHLPNSLVH